MIIAGDIRLADLSDERRHTVLVVSTDRFHKASGRVLIAPQLPSDDDEVLFPWRVRIDGAVYAIDLLRSVPVDRLLDRTDRAPAAAMTAVRRALMHIT